MKLCAFLTTVGALLLHTLPVLGQSAVPAGGASSPWTKNRAIGEGQGLKTGPVVWHPGVSTEFGYDSNYAQVADSQVDRDAYGPIVPALRLRVTPQLSLRSRTESSEVGGQGAMSPFLFDAAVLASYNEFISLKSGESMAQNRNLEGGGDLNLRLLPGRHWSGRGGASYTHRAEPSNQGGGGETLNRHLMGADAGLDWAPGGGRFRWTLLEYATAITLFDEVAIRGSNNAEHHFTSHGIWHFLPKTGMLYDARLSTLDYASLSENTGETLQARVGLNGLVSKKIGLLAMGGWAASFFQNRNGVVRNYSSLVTHLEAKWFLSAHGRLKEGGVDVGASTLAVGFMRDFHESYIGDFYRRERIYGEMSYLIGTRVLTSFSAGISSLAYPDFYSSAGEQSGFGETRYDFAAFTEYRPLETVGVNLQLGFDANSSKVILLADSEDDLSFSRFRAVLGVRWFL